jgi:aspartate/glutamate racemase
MPRIALIHALALSMAPINDALASAWPQAERLNLLDDSLSADLDRAARGLDGAMTVRFHRLADYAMSTGADAILFTCSAFGPCIESVARRLAPVPVLKPNEAMIDAAATAARRSRRPIGLVASFAPTLRSMPGEFPPDVTLHTALADGALAALEAGDAQRHDQLVSAAAAELQARGCGVIALAQFSLARAADEVARHCALPVLTTPASAVAALRRRLGAASTTAAATTPG